MKSQSEINILIFIIIGIIVLIIAIVIALGIYHIGINGGSSLNNTANILSQNLTNYSQSFQNSI